MSWTRKQSRLFSRLVSWCTYLKGLDYQFLRVDLTTALGGEPLKLRRHLQELRRRVERVHGYGGLLLFVVETSEGNGVLHMVWAWRGSHSFFISQRWLSEEWKKIHGAPVVWVCEMSLGKADIRRVARYFALQYLANQSALVRSTYSWRRGHLAIAKSWEYFKREWRRKFTYNVSWVGFNLYPEEVTWYQFLDAWDELLFTGKTELAGFPYVVWNGMVQETF